MRSLVRAQDGPRDRSRAGTETFMFYSIGRTIASLGGNDILAEFEDVADRIQRSLLDITLPKATGLEIGVRAAPARIVGGDYVDVIERPDRSPIFAIGDASGKSLPAALRAIALKYMVRALASVLGDDLPTILTRANEVICADIEPDSFVTFLVATLTDNNRRLIVANGGHDPPLIYRARSARIDEMEIGGMATGIEPTARYREQHASVTHGDVVVFYTDGFTEARSPTGELFTLAHVKSGLNDYHDLAAQALADALFERIEEHVAGRLTDDATILVIRVRE